MNRLALNDDWTVRYEDLSWGPDMHEEAAAQTERWMSASLPCDIHMPLIENGEIPEPLIRDHSFASEWMEQKSWWFKKTFRPEDAVFVASRAELVLESLDAEADIFLNGRHLGHHRSTFHPFRTDVRKLLVEGENTLLVRVSSGVEYYSEWDLARFKDRVGMEKVHNRGERGRIFVRKPQYVYGWDWGPRVVTCGIVGDVYLETHEQFAIHGVRAVTERIRRPADVEGGHAHASADVRFEIEIEQFHAFATVGATMEVVVAHAGKEALKLASSLPLQSGFNYVELTGEIPDARLWWPNGMGEPELYTVSVEVRSEKTQASYPQFQFGVRTVRLDQQRIDAEEHLFAVEINGVRTFSKGANWIPADSIYARVADEKYRVLIEEARESNFNMLRIWGGGIYERDAFYEECDRNGIMIWHDFMFACALYPDDEEWFREEVRLEMEYQTRRLRNHASLVLWCGNNENHWGYYLWQAANPQERLFGGEICYNVIAPRAVRNNCPDIPYWNGSPYGGSSPNDPRMGDCHHWFETTMNPEMAKRITPEEYDKVTAKFISEFGYIGPCRKSTIESYHGDIPLDRGGRIWSLHNNTHEKETVEAGIAMHYTGERAFDLEQYLLYAGLCQGLMYQYSLEAMRYKTFCSGGLFWMYNDCWGETGWSIIDYELRRKISFYFVKRAFEPVKYIIRADSGKIRVIGINETGATVRHDAEFGYVSFDGAIRRTERTKLRLEPYSRSVVLEFAQGGDDLHSGCYFVDPAPESETVGALPAIMRTSVFRKLNMPAAELTIHDYAVCDDDIRFTVRSDTFAHAVHFGAADDLRLSDEFFDMLPGQSRTVTIFNGAGRINDGELQAFAVNPEPAVV